MKQHILAAVTTLTLCLSLVTVCLPKALAYTDNPDPVITEAVAVLTGMGIVSGYADGDYHPSENLTRAQFCKLATLLQGKGDEAAASSYRSLFSDLSSNHWALGYVNLAYSEGLVSGYGNGRFGPEDAITADQAVTVVLHVLGYQNAEIGPFWPEDYLSKAAKLGLTDGLSVSAGTVLTRGQAAVLLYNALHAANKEGKTYYNTWAAATVVDAVLVDADDTAEDGRTGTAQVYAGGAISWYDQVTGLDESLVGRRGTLLLNASGKTVGFLPDALVSKTVSLSKVAADGLTDTAGGTYSLSAQTKVFTGEDCGIYSALWYDLEASSSAVVYYAESGSIDLVYFPDGGRYGGTLLSGVYENALPNASAPTQITMLGIDLEVTDGAAGSLTDFVVGDKITVELDGEGKVAAAYAAADKKTDVIGVLESVTDGTAKVTLLSGLTATGAVTGTLPSERVGGLVKVTASTVGKLNILSLSGSAATGNWNVAAGTLGKVKVAADMRIFDQVQGIAAVEVEKEDVGLAVVPAASISYVRQNSAGEVDLLVLDNVTGDCYSYGFLVTGIQTSGSGEMTATNYTVAVENSAGVGKSGITGTPARNEATAGAVVTPTEKLVALTYLTQVEGVSRADFSGEAAVTADGYLIPVSTGVEVYNSQTEQWTTLAAAKAFTSSFTVYYDKSPGEGGKIRLIVTE